MASWISLTTVRLSGWQNYPQVEIPGQRVCSTRECPRPAYMVPHLEQSLRELRNPKEGVPSQREDYGRDREMPNYSLKKAAPM